MLARSWDYLIVTASNDRQARAYQMQLDLRRELGLLADVNEVLVVPDPGGRRIGSGGSTLACLGEVLRRRAWSDAGSPEAAAAGLEGLRILIVHAGGDSRRLPAYGPCGKILVPVPGESDRAVPMALIDRQLQDFLRLPAPEKGSGTFFRNGPRPPLAAHPASHKRLPTPFSQVVIVSGDILLCFDPSEARFGSHGITALSCPASPERAAHHGVFCRGAGDEVRLFLQKPTPQQQRQLGAVDPYGQSLLDVGVMSFDAGVAGRLFQVFGVPGAEPAAAGQAGEIRQAMLREGLDLYREICCAIGSEVTWAQYLDSTRANGSTWDERLLRIVFDALRDMPWRVCVLPQCDFLHFGATRQIISSGYAILHRDLGVGTVHAPLDIGNEVSRDGRVVGPGSWVEGCRVRARLDLGGENVVTGVDIDDPLSLPRGACLDLAAGTDRQGHGVWFVRCYGIDDTFKDTVGGGATFCGRAVLEWLQAIGAGPADAWGDSVPIAEQSVWTARLFPAVSRSADWRHWLWMFDPAGAGAEAARQWSAADRYSMSEIAERTDLDGFFRRRAEIRSQHLLAALRRLFRPQNETSAAELALAMRSVPDRLAWVAGLLREAHWHHHATDTVSPGSDALVVPRILHTLGSSVEMLEDWRHGTVSQAWPDLLERLDRRERDWLGEVGLLLDADRPVSDWAARCRALAFEAVGRAILSSGEELGRSASPAPHPVSALRADEIVWGRAPARLDLAGGWSDTPPYSLEYGGSVVNVAVDLNGLPPIQAYARVISEPLIRISSIDLGSRVEIHRLEELLDYRNAESEFALVKAALALCGFAPGAGWPGGCSLTDMLARFGGGIEMTTLAAIPKGSGLGTSSIMGAVILAVLRRVMGHTLSPRELFHGVLRLEQALTTGGGWQDQIGGATGGAKIISTAPGLVPDARIHYLPGDAIDPLHNGGVTLLYYTGATRLARNILAGVVGRYLDRDRRAVATLRRIAALAPQVADALSAKDLPLLGGHVAEAWALKKRLDPEASNPAIEELLARVAPYIHGAKLPGAGGGGFLFMVCKSPDDARRVRADLESHPPNPRARFFDFQISDEGLVVTVC